MLGRHVLVLVTAVLVTLLAASPAAEAKRAKHKARDFCKAWERDHPGEECGYVRGLVCTGRDWKKIRTFDGLWTACRQVRGHEDRERAEKRCRNYRENVGKSCEVHYPGCRAGWVKLAKHGRYAACRRIEASGNLRYDGYKAFMRKWEGEAGTSMPRHMQHFVEKHYDVDASKIRWGFVSNPHAGCTTDCYDIYCKQSTGIPTLLAKNETFSQLMFHEIAHVEQCRKKGGRKNYALMWFGDLPVGFFDALGNVRDEFKTQVHDLMPMEKAAEHKATQVMQRYLNGDYDKTWKCRLYRDDTLLWESPEGHFRAECEDKAHATWKKAMAKAEAVRARGGHGRFAYVFGRKEKRHHVLWEQVVAAPAKVRPVAPARAPKGN